MEDMNNNIEGAQAEEVKKEPVYSQMSLEYVASQVKKAKRKGFIQGFCLTLGIVLIATTIYMGISIVKMVADGSLYARTLGSVGGSILDKQTIDKVEKVYRIMENTYIEEVDKEAVREGIYKGMLEALDDIYSQYYTAEEYSEMMESSSGIFEGIGAYLSQDPETMQITIVRPIKDSPAEAVGLLANDILVEVDGEDIAGQDLNLVVSKVRGPEGTSVDIGVYREGEEDIIHFEVVRAKVSEQSVESEMLDNDMGYIIITEFADKTGSQFADAYDELVSQGMKSLIIDLRGNGGGYVDTSVEVADKILKGGIIVSIKDRHGLGYSYEDKGDDNFASVPIVVLVDANTASASEILTCALKDYEKATIIGTHTFGKGIVQDILPIGDGSGLKITNSKYYSPNGYNIHKIGIDPDIEVKFDRDKYIEEGIDVQLEKAIEVLNEKVKGSE